MFLLEQHEISNIKNRLFCVKKTTQTDKRLKSNYYIYNIDNIKFVIKDFNKKTTTIKEINYFDIFGMIRKYFIITPNNLNNINKYYMKYMNKIGLSKYILNNNLNNDVDINNLDYKNLYFTQGSHDNELFKYTDESLVNFKFKFDFKIEDLKKEIFDDRMYSCLSIAKNDSTASIIFTISNDKLKQIIDLNKNKECKYKNCGYIQRIINSVCRYNDHRDILKILK